MNRGKGCGLMQKQLVKQRNDQEVEVMESCGLMQKQLVKQQTEVVSDKSQGCGLMQKQLVKQLITRFRHNSGVAV